MVSRDSLNREDRIRWKQTLDVPLPPARAFVQMEIAVGILAHAWEQKQRGGRIMGPMPREIPYRYSGPARRDVPPRAADAAPERSTTQPHKDRGN